MKHWIAICQLEDIPQLGARQVVRVQGMPIAIFRARNDQVHALLDRCPHKGGPLSQGIVHGEHVACPLHNWSISLVDGNAKAPDEGCTPVFACKLEGGQVFLDAREVAEKALEFTAPVAGPCRHATAR